MSRFRQMVRDGGPIQQAKTERGRQEMAIAAGKLPQLAAPMGPSSDIFFLSGARYWYQTLFCAWSMQRHSKRRLVPVIFDDGSLSEENLDAIRAAIPWVRFTLKDEIAERLDQHLPEGRYPTLRRRRLDYPHLRKLTDIHIGRTGWTMVMDSDMIFHRRPTEMLNWLEHPDRACCMIDAEPAYGYSDALLRELAGGPLPELANVGVCALKSDEIDWDRLEYWCRVTLEREGPAYVQEQALSAMLMAGKPLLRLPAQDYVVRPDLVEGAQPRAVLHHYVAQSKRSYFQHGWRLATAGAEMTA